MATDFYSVLGVKKNASEKDIRQAFRKLARQYHPDVNPGNAEAEARFKEINAAYEVLSDPESRRKYDKYGDNWQHADQIEEMQRQRAGAAYGNAGGFGGFGFGGAPGASGGQTFEFDLSDLEGLGDFAAGGGRSGGGSIFDSLFRRGSGGRRGQTLEHPVQIPLEEAYNGASRTVEVRDAEETCRICGGAGQLAGATCHACRGSGVAAPVRRIEVSIPPGVGSGQRVRVAGRGAPGANGAPAGDLVLHVEVLPHPRFERKGDDLYTDVDVPVVDAALGGEVRVPTLKGRMLALRIPPGTQSGRTFRLAGQGMPRQRGGGFGDLHARVRLVLPDALTEEQRRLFEQLRETTAARTAEGATTR